MKSKEETEEIRFEIENGIGTITASINEMGAGYLYFVVISPNEWSLNDLKVKERAYLPPNRLRLFFISLGLLKAKTINFRRRGIGTRLLKRFLVEADKKGVETIQGEITKNDYSQNPNLHNWYQKHGFKLLPSDESCKTTAAYKILRTHIRGSLR